MDKILDLLKRRLWVDKANCKKGVLYSIHLDNNQVTEEEYNLILNFLNSEEEENEQHNN